MDPSEEKKQDKPPSPVKKKTSILLPLIVVLLLFSTIGGIAFYFNSGSRPVQPAPPASDDMVTAEETRIEETGETVQEDDTESPLGIDNINPVVLVAPEPQTALNEQDQEQLVHQNDQGNSDAISAPPTAPTSNPQTEPKDVAKISICDSPVLQLHTFYKHLDSQAYMADYKLSASSEKHFTDLINKLLANPPQVTRESDDLYTILKNTAHFFRVSGKDNIIMLKGILDNEKGSLEQILADYYLLISRPECSITTYSSDIDKDALYEYACFFLNTMGGRLYLFRRDSLSRMVVTYYAILLVDQANLQNNNFHGIALKPAVDMLIAEMEAGGSTLKRSDTYLDKLYELKETYQ